MMERKDIEKINLMFLLEDIVYSMLFEVEESLKKQHMVLKHEMKQNFTKAINDVKKAKKSCLRATVGVSAHRMDDYIDYSDYLKETIELLFDRTLFNGDNQIKIKSLVQNFKNEENHK